MKAIFKPVVILPAAALLAGLLTIPAIVGCGRSKPQQATTDAATAGTPVLVEAATRGSLRDEIVLTGTAEADQDSTINAEVAGNVAAVYVRVGDRVSAGQSLVRLDTDLASAQLAQSAAMVRSAQARQSQSKVNVRLTDQSTQVAVRQAEIGVEAAREQLKKAQNSYDLTRNQTENGVAQAQTVLDSARATLKDVQAGSRAQEIAQAQAALDQAKASLRQAQSDYNRQKALLAAGAVSAQQLDAAQTNLEVAQGRADAAAQALSLAKEGARGEQVRLAELGVQQAQQALQLAESRRDQVLVAERDVHAAESALSNAQQQLAYARAQRQQVAIQQQEAQAAAASVGQARAGEQYASTNLTKLYIRAPFSGQVAERLIEPGAGAGTSTALIRLVSLQPMKVTAQVSELQVARLHVGQTAQCTVDGLPGRVFPGRIARLSPAAIVGQRTYTAQIRVDNAQNLIKPGMFCRTQIVLATVADAVVVSRDALVENGTQRQVYAVEGGKVVIRPVEVGARSDGSLQILSGVKEGDQLVVSGQSLLASGQQVAPQARNSGAESAGQQGSAPPPPSLAGNGS